MMSKCALYLGLKPPPGVYHYPMIKIVPLNPPISFERITHLIATSQTVLELIRPQEGITVLAVGKKTASKVPANKTYVAQQECAEGVIDLLKEIDRSTSNILYPHSAKARPLISDFLKEHRYRFREVLLYDTVYQALQPLPQLEQFDRVIFTSPSTVDAFFLAYRSIPSTLKVECIGEITADYLTKKLEAKPGPI